MNEHFYKYIKYKSKYLNVKSQQAGGLKLSGPISFYSYKILDKEIILLGDSHQSWNNMCNGVSNPNIKDLYLKIIASCREQDDCYYIINYIDKIAKESGNPVHFFYESEYHAELDQKISLQKIRKKIIKKGPSGPLDHVRFIYGKCLRNDVLCYNNTIAHQADYRSKIELDALYSEISDILKEFDKFGTKIYTFPPALYNFIIGQYPIIAKKIVASMYPFVSFTNTEALLKLNDDQLVEVMYNIIINIIQKDRKVLVPLIDDIGTEIKEKYYGFIKMQLSKNLTDQFRKFLLALSMVAQGIDSFIIEFTNFKKIYDPQTPFSPRVRKSVADIGKNIDDIDVFLLNFNTIFMDIYILAKLFSKSSNVQNAIIYAGQAHIENYIKFLETNSATPLQSVEPTKIDGIYNYDSDTNNRCLTIK